MKRIILCALCLLLLVSCGKQTESPQTTGAADEVVELPPDETSLDISAEMETAAEPTAKELTCEPLRKDGRIYGFEMRFRRTDTIDTMMASTDNFYFGVFRCGKKKIAVPTEEIRVLLDVPTDSFVITMLIPQGEKLSGATATVSFYISARTDGVSKALFAAQQAVDIS